MTITNDLSFLKYLYRYTFSSETSINDLTGKYPLSGDHNNDIRIGLSIGIDMLICEQHHRSWVI